ncbi:signal peptidase I [[Clostridium] symbiosum]|uniref:signal peptidase I n=1 Tax=Clostridium symbiosum TaxID=1512 RepID=UPI001D069F7F|nr:signal peptidase I [[Clostridium] symbiosum]MCB6607207.1 signal peptidase I [[Clostridium] symbiosum]MCB6929767.1 signal peptidase I [[Clostridium] symbiosum]
MTESIKNTDRKRDKEKQSIRATVACAVLCIIFIPIIIINMILIAGTYLHPGDMPGVFGVKPVVVLSGSMEPVISTGDLIVLQKADYEELKEGDVICYLTSGQAVTHRIVRTAMGEDGQIRYITRGDANNTDDRLAVSADQIQGIWKGLRIGGMGNAVMFMQTPAGMLLFIVCPLLLFIFWDIMSRRKSENAEKERTAMLEAQLADLMRKQSEEAACSGQKESEKPDEEK